MTERLTAARRTEAELLDQLDHLADRLALVRMDTRATAIELALLDTHRGEDDDPEELRGELEALRTDLPASEQEVLENGELVTDIPWKDGVDIHYAFIWSYCGVGGWVLLKVSNWQPGRVGGLVMSGAMVVYKWYGGNFQLMRYRGRFYWVRVRPSTIIRRGGPAGPLAAALCTPYTRIGMAGYILTSIHDDRIRIGPAGPIVTCLTGDLIRDFGPHGRVLAAIDGDHIRRGGPAGVIWCTVDGEATPIEKAALASGVMRIDGWFDPDEERDGAG